jgi:hypothetical protein
MTSHRMAVVMLVLCGACSGRTTQMLGSQWVTGTFGPNGGTLTVRASDNASIAGTQIIIPAGALSAQTTIKIGVTDQAVVAPAIARGPVIDFEPSGTVFAKNVTMTIPVTPNGLSASQIAVMAVEAGGDSRTIAPVTIAGNLATFQASGFTFFGCFESEADGGEDTDAGCTPSCSGDASCGSSDGCGGTCDANCEDAGVDAGCVPNCDQGYAGCGTSDGCGGTCDNGCPDAGCTANCPGSACGAADNCGGICTANCDFSDAGCLTVSPTSIDFGNVGIDQDSGVILTSQSQSFTISNNCANAATVQSMTIQSGFEDFVPQFSVPAGPPLPLTIQPSSAAETYELFCEPTREGTHTGELVISDGTFDTLVALTCSCDPDAGPGNSFDAGNGYD